MRPFFVKLYLATALVHVPFGWALGALSAWWLGAVAGAVLAVGFHHRFQLQLRDRPISGARARLVEEPYFVHWCACMLAPLCWLPLSLGLGAARGYAAAYLGALLLGVWGVVIRRRRAVVREIELRVPHLHRAFDGYRIALLSDLHVGSLCPQARAEAWVATANALDADLIALTGDYCTTSARFHRDIARALSGLSARDGVVAVMGNHDYFDDGEPLMTLLGEAGIRLLRNAHLVIARGAAKLCLAGVDDRYTRRYDPARALSGRDPALPLLVLAHDPESFVELAELGADVVLSGHTHWGQVAVPWWPRLSPARWWARFYAGLYRHGRAQLYVTPGLGTTGPPVRLGTAPEITAVTLRA